MKINLEITKELNYQIEYYEPILKSLYPEGFDSLAYAYIVGDFLRDVWDFHYNEDTTVLICSEFPEKKHKNRIYSEISRIGCFPEYIQVGKISEGNSCDIQDVALSFPLSSSQIVYDLKTKNLFYSDAFEKTMQNRLITTTHEKFEPDIISKLKKLTARGNPFYLSPRFWELIPNLSTEISPYPEELINCFKVQSS